MSSNFFAALDDSGDEATGAPKSVPKKLEPKAVKPSPVGGVGAVESSAKTARRQPNNDRNTKHGRGGRAPTRDGKRAYDRRSGTGRGKEIKKGGGGARNWGNEKADAKTMEGKIVEEETKEETVPEETEGQSPSEEPAQVQEPEPEPEDNTMTLAEYMASKGRKEETSGRQVENEFAGKMPAKKVEEDFLVLGEGKSKRKKKGKDEAKQAIEVGFRVAADNDGGVHGGRGRGRGEGRGRGRSEGRGGRGEGRGGRGEGRGGRGEGRGGRGEGRGGRGERGGRGRGEGRGRGRGPRNEGLNVMDENAFPSL